MTPAIQSTPTRQNRTDGQIEGTAHITAYTWLFDQLLFKIPNEFWGGKRASLLYPVHFEVGTCKLSPLVYFNENIAEFF